MAAFRAVAQRFAPLGREAACRTVEYAGHSYEEIPAAKIREAARRAAGVEGE